MLFLTDEAGLVANEYRYDCAARSYAQRCGPDIRLEFDDAGALLARYGHGQRTDQPLTMARDLDASGTFDPGESFYYHADLPSP